MKEFTTFGLIGHIDHGKTTIVKALGLKPHSEFRGITQRPSFFRLKRSIIVDLPGHELFSYEREFALKLLDVIILVVSVLENKLSATIVDLLNGFEGGRSYILALTKCDLNPDYESNAVAILDELSRIINIDDLRIFYMPSDASKLRECIEDCQFPKVVEHTYGLIVSNVVYKGLGSGYELIPLSDLSERRVYLGGRPLRVKRIVGNLTESKLENMEVLHSDFSVFIRLSEDVKLKELIPLFSRKVDYNNETVEAPKTSENDVPIVLRAGNLTQLHAVKDLVLDIASRYKVSVRFIYESVGTLNLREMEEIRSFNPLIISFNAETDSETIYSLKERITGEIKSIRIGSIDPSYRLVVRKIFDNIKVAGRNTRILGGCIDRSWVEVNDYFLIGPNFHKVVRITLKGQVVDTAKPGKDYAFQLSRTDFKLDRGEVIYGYREVDIDRELLDEQ